MNNKANIDVKDFLCNFWQKKSLTFRQYIDTNNTYISGDVLAGLAYEENIESRIIRGSNESNNWDCQFGPFKEFDYDSLGKKNWTLLVQSVDHFIPEVRALLSNFGFIPQWRLDDIMVSYAAEGGGVGPHFDYYDVFLIQLSGSREWKIGQYCDQNTKLRNHPDLKLLESFEQTNVEQLNQGDMIYIPAGLAHWGTATSDDCITASIGFRAPSYQDLVYAAALDISSQYPEHLRYCDTKIQQLDSYCLDNLGHDIFADIYQSLDKKHFIKSLRTSFAKEVTLPRHEELFYPFDIALSDVVENLSRIQKHSNARFAYISKGNSVILFVNGHEIETNLATALAICHSDYNTQKEIDMEVVTELVRAGILIIQ